MKSQYNLEYSIPLRTFSTLIRMLCTFFCILIAQSPVVQLSGALNPVNLLMVAYICNLLSDTNVDLLGLYIILLHLYLNIEMITIIE